MINVYIYLTIQLVVLEFSPLKKEVDYNSTCTTICIFIITMDT